MARSVRDLAFQAWGPAFDPWDPGDKCQARRHVVWSQCWVSRYRKVPNTCSTHWQGLARCFKRGRVHGMGRHCQVQKKLGEQMIKWGAYWHTKVPTQYPWLLSALLTHPCPKCLQFIGFSSPSFPFRYNPAICLAHMLFWLLAVSWSTCHAPHLLLSCSLPPPQPPPIPHGSVQSTGHV